MEGTTTTTREKLADPVKIRFRQGVLEELERRAETNGSTVNEVVRRLVDKGLEPANGTA